jgi:hypothetical protein
MHELGHNLNLTHGGNTNDHVNYKPNHLSIMSYSFQVIGVWRDGGRKWDYTRTTIDALNENALNETVGVTGAVSLANYGTRYYCPDHTTRDDNTVASVDWSCNGALSTPVSVDINWDNTKNILGPVQNQWLSLVYNGGSIGAGLRPLRPQRLDAEAFLNISPELKYEDTLNK